MVRIGGNLIGIKPRIFMYREGPILYMLAFKANLGDPNMKYIEDNVLFYSEMDLKNKKSIDQKLLSIVNQSHASTLVERILVADKIINSSIRYPVIVIGLKHSTPKDAIDFFENLGYDKLKV